MNKKRLYQIIEVGGADDKLSKIYDVFMMCIIVASIIPLAFKTQNSLMIILERISVIIFLIDYLLRWWTADIKVGSKKAFLLYPFSIMAIADLLSILPSITFFNSSLKLLKIFRLLRSFRIFRVFKIVRYSKSINMILSVFRNQKETLITIGWFAMSYILISALVILNVEPDTFNTYFDAVYWATVSLTTVGYGDIYPVTTVGKIITMISSIFGIAIVAMPAGIITAGMIEEIENNKK